MAPLFAEKVEVWCGKGTDMETCEKCTLNRNKADVLKNNINMNNDASLRILVSLIACLVFLRVLHAWQAPRISLADGAGSPGSPSSAGSPSAASATATGATGATGQPDGERKSMSLAPR